MTRVEQPLNQEIITVLDSVTQGPCLSLYQETHRSSPDNIQDPIRFRNLVKSLKDLLQEKYPEAILQDFMEPFEALENDTEFWAHTREGLAVLVDTDHFHIFHLQRPVHELAVAENYFFLSPLRRYLQSKDRFQILGLSLNKVQLFEGTRNNLDEIILDPGVPENLRSAVGEKDTEDGKNVSSHFGVGHGTIPARHSYGDKQNDIDLETEKFFRTVDKAVSDLHSRPTGLPLVLACLPEQEQLFHRISNNPLLLEGGLGINPEHLSLSDLMDRAWQFFEPHYTKQLTTLAEEFLAANAKGLGSEAVAEIEQAANDGRVATLLLESTQEDDVERGKIQEELATLVGKMGGLVQIIPSDCMPGKTGVAASYRY